MFPLLSLAQIELDPALVRRLPRALAYYHQALLIAQDEAHIAVAMAYPDRAAVVQVLENVLGMAIKPVRSDPAEIRAGLDQVWQGANDTQPATLLTWGDGPAQHAQALAYASGIAPVFGFQCDNAAERAQSLDDLLHTAQQVNPALIVTALSDPAARDTLVHRASTSVLMIHGSVPFPGKILHILRGHTPDRYVLDWLIPLAHHFAAQVTLLAAATPSSTDYRQGSPLISDFANLLMRDHPAHLIEYGQVLASVNLNGQLKIRQGLLETTIADELGVCQYDLVAIATEAYGNFVNRVLHSFPDSPMALLIVKPHGWSASDPV